MLGLIVSTVVYFAASHYTKRWLDDMDIPKSFTRSTAIFCFALIIAYAFAALADWLFP